MAKLTISTSVSDGRLWLYLDHALVLQNGDSVSIELQTGQEFVLHWFVNGKPGSSYSITISSPKDAQFQLMRGLQFSGKDYGGFKFKV